MPHSPLEITNTRNQRQIQSEDLFLREHYVFGNKSRQNRDRFIVKTFLPLEKIFPLSIFDCGCMPSPLKNPRYTTGLQTSK